VSYLLRMVRRDDRRILKGRCTITRGTYPNLTSIPNVPCRVRPSLRATNEVASGGEVRALHLYDVRLPFETDIRRGDTLHITRSSDPQMVNRWLTVREATIDEDIASRTVVAEESVG
jgi:hypothetical protein